MCRVRLSVRCTLAAALPMLLAAGCEALHVGSIEDSVVLTSSSSSPSQPVSSPLLEAIRSSLSSESWRPNHTWTAEAEWEKHPQDFPAPRNLRWTFGKDVEETLEQGGDKDGSEGIAATTSPAARRRATAAKSANSSSSSSPGQPEPSKSQIESAAGTAAKSSGKASSPDDSPHWDGFWPLTVTDLVRRGDRAKSSTPTRDAATAETGLQCLKQLAGSDNLTGWNAAILWAQHDPSSAIAIADVLENLFVHPPSYAPATGDSPDSSNANDPLHNQQNAIPRGTKRPIIRKNTSATAETKPADSIGDSKIFRRPSTISVATQCAAAEAWCLVLAASAPDPIDGLAPAGLLLESPGLSNGVRAELFRSVARWVRPADIPRIENALREGEEKRRAPAEIRRAAIDACLIYAVSHDRSASESAKTGQKSHPEGSSTIWPATVMICRIDPDFEVRHAFLHWLGYARPDEAFELLKAQAEAGNLGLRQAAMEGLGKLRTDEANSELKSLVKKTRESLRAVVVRALANWGVEEAVPFAHDPSPTVRMTVIAELERKPTIDSAVVLSELATDKSVDVEVAAVRAARNWPDALAFPLFLQAMRDSSPKTRLVAADQISARRKLATKYRFDGPPQERETAVNAIAAEIGSPVSYLDKVLERVPAAAAQVNELRSAEVRSHLAKLIETPSDSASAAAAREWLAGIGPKDVAVVESFLKEPTKASPDPIYRDILPAISPAYAALVDLESTDVNIRRRGAQALGDRGQKTTLSRPILVRLKDLLLHETDELVWRSAMAAVMSDSTEECADVANLALQNKLSEVRQLGCEYLSRHGQPAQATWVLDLLEDHSRTVQLAAIRALGNCGNLVAVNGLKPEAGRKSSPSLRRLLASPDSGLRFAAAVSLCRLGAAEGMQEMVRMSYDVNSQVREKVVKEMGLSGQTRFVDHLVTLGWTEQNEQVRRTILESLDRLVPAENRPPMLGAIPASDAKIKCWVQWMRQRNGTPPQEISAGSPLASRPERQP